MADLCLRSNTLAILLCKVTAIRNGNGRFLKAILQYCVGAWGNELYLTNFGAVGKRQFKACAIELSIHTIIIETSL